MHNATGEEYLRAKIEEEIRIANLTKEQREKEFADFIKELNEKSMQETQSIHNSINAKINKHIQSKIQWLIDENKQTKESYRIMTKISIETLERIDKKFEDFLKIISY